MPFDQKLYESSDNTPKHAIMTAGTDTLWVNTKIVIDEDTAAGTVIAVCEVPSNFVVVGGALENDAAPSAGDYSLGLYETEEHGGEVINVSMFIANQAVDGANTASIFEEIALADQDKTLYELANEEADFDMESATRQAFIVGLRVISQVEGGDSTMMLRIKLARKS